MLHSLKISGCLLKSLLCANFFGDRAPEVTPEKISCSSNEFLAMICFRLNVVLTARISCCFFKLNMEKYKKIY